MSSENGWIPWDERTNIPTLYLKIECAFNHKPELDKDLPEYIFPREGWFYPQRAESIVYKGMYTFFTFYFILGKCSIDIYDFTEKYLKHKLRGVHLSIKQRALIIYNERKPLFYMVAKPITEDTQKQKSDSNTSLELIPGLSTDTLAQFFTTGLTDEMQKPFLKLEKKIGVKVEMTLFRF